MAATTTRPGFAQGQQPNLGQPPAWAQGQRPNLVQQAARTQARTRGTTNQISSAAAAPNDAQAFLLSYLGQFGLQQLAGWAWQRYTALGGGQAAMDQINLELPEQQAFQQRFPAISARQKAGLPQLTPAEYLQYEASVNQELTLVGAPPAIRAGTAAFRDIVTQALAGDVSVSEMQARIEGGYQAVRDADPSVRNWFAQKFGVQGDQALAAYFLAPEHAESTLARMEREAEVGGAGARAGIDVGTGLAGQVAAVAPSGSVDQQFQRLAQLNPLFHQRVAGDPSVTTDQGVSAEFGLDPNAAAAVQRELDTRAASVAGGPTVTSDQAGLTGTGTAR